MEMNVRVVLYIFTFWVIGDVEELIVVIASIRDAMRVVAILPNPSGQVIANGEGKASLDQLDAAPRRGNQILFGHGHLPENI